MKKFFVSFAAALFCAASVWGQDMATLTEIYNNGAAALGNGEKVEALKNFREALNGATALGEAGAELATNCRNVIPSLILSIAKDTFRAGNTDGAINTANEALAAAKEYGNAEAEGEAAELIDQLTEQKASALLNAKDFAGAVAAYKGIVEKNATDGTSWLRLGMAYTGLKDNDSALEAFKKAAENGEEKSARKQISMIDLKAAAAALKLKDYKSALEKAQESAQINPSATAFKIAGTAAAQLKQYGDAAEYFSKYLEVNPAAKDAVQVKQNIEAFKKLAK